MLKFGYTIAYVADVEATLAFYERAFGLARRYITPDGTFGALETGETALAFASFDLAAQNFPAGVRSATLSDRPSALEIALVTDDVKIAFERAVAAGAVVLAEPSEKPWGQTVAFVRDLNGLVVELCAPM